MYFKYITLNRLFKSIYIFQTHKTLQNATQPHHFQAFENTRNVITDLATQHTVSLQEMTKFHKNDSINVKRKNVIIS